MNFTWIYHTPDKNWWANYRWHIVESSEKLGLKSDNWKKTFFRSGWQKKALEVEGIDNAKKCLQGLRNGTITAFGGRFRGASYDKNAERIVKQAKRSLKTAIKKYGKVGNIKIEEIAIVPNSYYNWGVIISIGGIVVLFIAVLIVLLWRRKKNKKMELKK